MWLTCLLCMYMDVTYVDIYYCMCYYIFFEMHVQLGIKFHTGGYARFVEAERRFDIIPKAKSKN